MKRLLCVASFVAFFAGSANAQSALFASTPTAYNWTGFYIGLNAGFGGDSFDYPIVSGGSSGNLNLTSSGIFGGVQAGYNFQFTPTWLVGVEADIAAANIKGSVSGTGGGFSGSAGSNVTYFGTVRGRMGWVRDRLLLYATGGLAYGSTTSTATGSGGGFSGTATKTLAHVGWTIGAGVEYALTDRVSLKTEYKYVDLGTKTLFSNSSGSFSEKTKFHTLLVGLNYRF